MLCYAHEANFFRAGCAAITGWLVRDEVFDQAGHAHCQCP